MPKAASVEPIRRNDDGTAGDLAEAPASSRFWRWMAFGVGVLAFAKGIREPNAWSYTQAQLNYSAGFIRRGLFGAVFASPLHLGMYRHFTIFSTALLLVLLGLLALFARTSRLAERAPAGELLAVYASSYSVTYLAHLNGYLDIPLAILCLAPLFVRPVGRRLAAAGVCAILGILIHEQFFFAFLPVLIVSILLGVATGRTKAERRLAGVGGVLLAVLGVALTWHLGRNASISEAQVEQLHQSIATTADRPLDDELLKVLPRTGHENLEIMKSVWARPTFPGAQAESLLFFGPTTLVLSYATFLLLRRWRPGMHWWLYAGVLMATLAPLSLHLVGWDKNRWNELLCLNAFLLLLTVANLFKGEPVHLPLWFKRVCLVVMLVNMATGGGMMDGRHIRPFPFIRSQDAAVGGVAVTGRS